MCYEVGLFFYDFERTNHKYERKNFFNMEQASRKT